MFFHQRLALRWGWWCSPLPCFLRDWELQVHFKIHGQGKKNLHGDGLAIWYTKDRMQPGPVFGNMDKFVGLGVFVDTYPNEEKQQERVFPYISAMVNNGSLSYDHERDGRPTELGGCTAIVRNLHYDTFLVIRYVKRHLTIMMDIDGKHEWRDCIEVPGVRLPRGYYFGTSSITGDLSDNHDVISLKLFELTVERTPEEEKLHRDVFLPSVDNMKLPEGERRGSQEMVLWLERRSLCLGGLRCLAPTACWAVSFLCSCPEEHGARAPAIPLVSKVQTSSVFKSRHLERERLSAPWLPEMSVRNWRLDAFPAGWAL
ncbi:VIP36-like protein isoform X6 [Ursus arctos]|uniref:VIP36-like protein isoform X6 n=1 Tax=Ursus arctos TaxID=9644 RepID=UPI0025482DE6|nr:VIP36-like protein isoform X6 [Ursus arctos]